MKNLAPINDEQDKVTKKYVDDAVDVLVDYSTAEQPTGRKWIDGKAIYQKTVSFGALPNNTNKSVAHGITNLDYIITFESVTKRSSDKIFQSSPRVNSSTINNQTIVEFDMTSVKVTSAANLSSYDVNYFTLYYTKT